MCTVSEGGHLNVGFKPAIKFLLIYFIGYLNNVKHEAPQNLTQVYVTPLTGTAVRCKTVARASLGI